MRYVCIRCSVEWIVNDGDDNLIPSHGTCFNCMKDGLIPIYRSRQRRENNPDCFGKAEGYCDQPKCLYYSICVENKLKSEE